MSTGSDGARGVPAQRRWSVVAVVLLAACGASARRPEPRSSSGAASGEVPVNPSGAAPAPTQRDPVPSPRPPAGATAPRPGGHALNGMATWYGPGFAGRRTANGERFDPSKMTAAHRTLPFGTRVRVVAERTGASVIVRINDRGPFGHTDRIIDLSRGAARRIGLDRAGVMRVRLEILPER